MNGSRNSTGGSGSKSRRRQISKHHAGSDRRSHEPDWTKLKKGVATRRFKAAIEGKPHVIVRGFVNLAWRSEKDRKACIEYEGKRWKQVEEYRDLFLEGKTPALGPIYRHPTNTGDSMNRAQEIDGARTQMAALEANIIRLPVIVIRATA